MKKLIYVALWLIIPFVIGAMYEFSESWIAIPASVILGVYWLGVTVALGKSDK